MAPSHLNWPARRTELRLSKEAIDDVRVRRLDAAHPSHIVLNVWSYLVAYFMKLFPPAQQIHVLRPTRKL